MSFDKQIKDFELFARDKFNVNPLTLNDFNKVNARYIEPTIVEERPMNVATFSVYSRLFMDRTLMLGTEVDADSANIINAQLMYLDSISEDDIKLWINSPGGSVTDGLAIYDIMNFVKSDVQTIGMGLCASMGAVLLSSGAKGKRCALPHSEILIHQPLGGVAPGSQASDIEIANRQMQKCKETLYLILSENTGKSIEEIAAAGDRDHWLTATEALDFGVIDKVIKRK